MRAGRASTRAGVTIKALRYYEGIGLLNPGRLSNGYRDYSGQDVRLASEIRALMSLGLSPKETQPFLDCLRDGHNDADDCVESLAAYQDKIDRLDLLIAQLSASRTAIAEEMQAAARRGFRSTPSPTEIRMLPGPICCPTTSRSPLTTAPPCTFSVQACRRWLFRPATASRCNSRA